MASIKYCPTCSSYNKKNKLILRQINFCLAIYMCEDKTCTYPDGYKFVQVEQRTLYGLLSEKKQKKTEETDLDNWLKDFFADDDSSASISCTDNSINNDDLSKIIDEISNTNNEYELDLEYAKDSFIWIDNAVEDLLERHTSGTDNSKETTNINKLIPESKLVAGTKINVQPIYDNTYKQLDDIVHENKVLNNSNIKSNNENLSDAKKCLSKFEYPGNKTVKNEVPKSSQFRILNFECSGFKNNFSMGQQNLKIYHKKIKKNKKNMPTTSSQARISNKFDNFHFNNILIKPPDTHAA